MVQLVLFIFHLLEKSRPSQISPRRECSQKPQLVLHIVSRHQFTVIRSCLYEAGGFFLGADHHPKTDTNSTPELASGCRSVKKCFIAVTPNQATQNIKGVFGLVLGSCAERWQCTRNSAQDPARKIIIWLFQLTIPLNQRVKR